MLPTSTRAPREEKAANFFRTCSTRFLKSLMLTTSVEQFTSLSRASWEQKRSDLGPLGLFREKLFLQSNVVKSSAIRRKKYIYLCCNSINNYCKKIIKVALTITSNQGKKRQMTNCTELFLCHMRISNR